MFDIIKMVVASGRFHKRSPAVNVIEITLNYQGRETLTFFAKEPTSVVLPEFGIGNLRLPKGFRTGRLEASAMEFSVQHKPEQRRFEVLVDGDAAYLEYLDHGKTLVMTHTFVPPSLRGKGLAGRLTQSALDFARREGKSVDPQCSYVAAYLDQHAEYAGLRETKS